MTTFPFTPYTELEDRIVNRTMYKVIARNKHGRFLKHVVVSYKVLCAMIRDGKVRIIRAVHIPLPTTTNH